MNLRKSAAGAALLMAALGIGNTANADPVACQGPPGQLRVLTVDPGKVGGLCYTQTGNLQEADVTAQGLDLLAKENTPGASEDPDDLLQVSVNAGGLSGTWSIASSVWEMFNNVYLGFHFGNAGGAGAAGDPDSFIVQIETDATSGTWSIAGLNGNAQLNALSNIQLIVCQASSPGCVPDPGGPGGGVPEPATGLLAALGLGLMAGLRRIGARVRRA